LTLSHDKTHQEQPIDEVRTQPPPVWVELHRDLGYIRFINTFIFINTYLYVYIRSVYLKKYVWRQPYVFPIAPSVLYPFPYRFSSNSLAGPFTISFGLVQLYSNSVSVQFLSFSLLQFSSTNASSVPVQFQSISLLQFSSLPGLFLTLNS